MYKYILDIGGRKEQQDSCAVHEKEEKILLALADGMGGHRGGALASNIFIKEVENCFDTSLPAEILFENIINSTKQKMLQEKEKDSTLDLHTTCVLALIDKEKLYFTHMGDSRLYYFKNEELLKKTKDHSVTQMLADMGEIEEKDIATHPDQNKVLKSISIEENAVVSYDCIDLDYENDFTILLCSDGFWEYIDEKEIVENLKINPLDEALENMVHKVKQRGGDKGDNISVVVYIHKAKNDSFVSNILNKISLGTKK